MDNENKKKLVALGFSVTLTAAILAYNPAASVQQAIGNWGYLGVFLVMLLSNATIVFPAPGLLTVFSAAGAYNPLLVGIAGGLGSGLGEVTGYLAGYGATTFFKEDKRYKRIVSWMKRNGFLTIFFLAAIPNPLFDIAGLSAGSLKYDWRKFVLACVAGNIIKAVAVAFLGYSLI